MYIARTGLTILNENGELEQKFYVLDEDNEYKLIKGHKLTFPNGTSKDDILGAVAQVVKDSYETDKGQSPNTLEEIKVAAIQPFEGEVVKVSDNLIKKQWQSPESA